MLVGCVNLTLYPSYPYSFNTPSKALKESPQQPFCWKLKLLFINEKLTLYKTEHR